MNRANRFANISPIACAVMAMSARLTASGQMTANPDPSVPPSEAEIAAGRRMMHLACSRGFCGAPRALRVGTKTRKRADQLI